jgi:hypothetical protein
VEFLGNGYKKTERRFSCREGLLFVEGVVITSRRRRRIVHRAGEPDRPGWVTEAAPDLEPTDCVEHFDVNVLKDACGNSRWLRNTCHLVYAIPAAVLSRNPRR